MKFTRNCFTLVFISQQFDELFDDSIKSNLRWFDNERLSEDPGNINSINTIIEGYEGKEHKNVYICDIGGCFW